MSVRLRSVAVLPHPLQPFAVEPQQQLTRSDYRGIDRDVLAED